jgi:hypothetical protein
MLPIEDQMTEQQRMERKTKGGKIEQETPSVKTRRVATVTLKTGEGIAVSSNEEVEATSKMYDFPYIYDSGDYPVEALTEGMQKEMSSMKTFDVFSEVLTSSLPPETVKTAISTRWVHRWKGDSVRSRLVCRGFTEEVADLDDTYASTPLLVMVKLLILISLSTSWTISFWDVGAAFLRAPVTTDIYVVPPQEYYDSGSVLWKLKKALYGLRTAPRAWQEHLAQLLIGRGFVRLQSEANVYVNMTLTVIVLVYVDGLMIVVSEKNAKALMPDLSTSLLLRLVGSLDKDWTRG